MKNKHRQLNLQFNNNRGVGIVTVIVTVAFLLILGTIILFTSYNGLQSRVASRAGEERFYDAETAINEIRLGLETKAAEAYSEAYSAILENYSIGESGVTDEQIAEFQDKYRDALADELSISTEFNNYPIEELQKLVLTNPESIHISYNGGESSLGTVTVSKNENNQTVFTFKDVTATSMEQGRAISVSADLLVTLPNLQYYISQYSISGVSSYCIISKNTLKVETNSNALLKGNVYAGDVKVGGAKLTINDGLFISAGDVVLGENAQVTSAADSELWVNSFALNDSSTLRLQGLSNVYNDLNFKGDNASAFLQGRYFGFGSSSSNSRYSSAILFNSTNSTLDISGLKELVLAGYSFIDSDNEEFANVRTGESMAPRSDQRIYLIPAESVRYTDEGTLASVASNPIVVNDFDVVKKMQNATIRTTDELLTGADVKTIAVPEGKSQWVVFFFMEFKDEQEASVYFKNYFNEHSDKLEDYIASYASVTASKPSNALAASPIQTKGYTFSTKIVTSKGDTLVEDQLTLNAYLKNADEVDKSAKSKEQQFINLCKTMTTYSVASEDGNAGATNPYDYIVNTAAIDVASGSSKSFVKDGKTVALLVNGNYTYDGRLPDLDVLLVTGNLTLEQDFSGLLLVGGSLSFPNDLSNQIKASSNEKNVSMAALAKSSDGDGTSIADYLNISFGTVAGEQSESSGTGSEQADHLVTIENWKKD